MNTRAEPPLPGLAAESELEVPQLDLLRVLADKPAMSQRELSRSLGLSLGKTHYVLHALLDKGLVKARNFTRSDNKMGYSYLLTPAGMHEKLRMTRQFLGRKEAEFEQLKATIAALRAEVDDTP
jgi:EPS-associated MarR family transcriptional regulator